MKLKAPFPYFGGKSRVAAAAARADNRAAAADAPCIAACATHAAGAASHASWAAELAQIKMICALGNPFEKGASK